MSQKRNGCRCQASDHDVCWNVRPNPSCACCADTAARMEEVGQTDG